jgi:hypothetical protein
MEEWRYSPTILDIGSIWRLVFSFTLRPFYPKQPFDRRLGPSQSHLGHCGEKKNLLPYRESNTDPSAVQPAAGFYTDWNAQKTVTIKYT